MYHFESKRFLLRPLTASDVSETYISWWNDAEIQSGLNCLPRNWTQVEAVQHVSRFDNRRNFHFGIFTRDTLALVGFIAVFITPVQIATMNMVIGDKQYWGQGVMDESVPVLCEWLFNSMGVVKIKSEAAGHNVWSIAMLKRLGFQLEGVLRVEMPHFKEGRVDKYVFGLLSDDKT